MPRLHELVHCCTGDKGDTSILSLSYTLLEMTIQLDTIQTLRTAGRGAAVVRATTVLRSADRRPAFPGDVRCRASRRKWPQPCTCTECPGQPR